MRTWRSCKLILMSLNAVEIALLRPLLGKVSFFESLEPQELDAVAAALDKVSFRKDETLIRQGDTGDAFYLVGSGAVRVVKDGTKVAELKEVGFFGEIALLFDVKRTATVEGTAPGDLYRMGRAEFERMIEANRLIGDLIRVTAQQRLAKEDSAPAN